MNSKQFDQVVEECVKAINMVLKSKSKEYSNDTDKLHNFNEAAKLLDCTNVYALVGMMNKHIVSVYDMVKKYETLKQLPTKEFLNEKIGDSINYLILLKACFIDKLDSKKEK
jgi:hypothetical protein